MWWYVRSGEKRGPISFKEIVSLFRNGSIDFETLSWTHGLNEWQPFGHPSSFAELTQNNDKFLFTKSARLTPRFSSTSNSDELKSTKIDKSFDLTNTKPKLNLWKLAVGLLLVVALISSLAFYIHYTNGVERNLQLANERMKMQLAQQKMDLEIIRKKEADAKDALAIKIQEAIDAKRQAAVAEAEIEKKSQEIAQAKKQADARAAAQQKAQEDLAKNKASPGHPGWLMDASTGCRVG